MNDDRVLSRSQVDEEDALQEAQDALREARVCRYCARPGTQRMQILSALGLADPIDVCKEHVPTAQAHFDCQRVDETT